MKNMSCAATRNAKRIKVQLEERRSAYFPQPNNYPAYRCTQMETINVLHIIQRRKLAIYRDIELAQ